MDCIHYKPYRNSERGMNTVVRRACQQNYFYVCRWSFIFRNAQRLFFFFFNAFTLLNEGELLHLRRVNYWHDAIMCLVSLRVKEETKKR